MAEDLQTTEVKFVRRYRQWASNFTMSNKSPTYLSESGDNQRAPCRAFNTCGVAGGFNP